MSDNSNSETFSSISKISVEALACVRSERIIFENVSFTVKAGEMLAIRGPNGVGKSTLLRIMSGLLSHVTGNIVFDGLSDPDDFQRYIHYLGHKDPIKSGLTVREQLEFWQKYIDTPDSRFKTGLTPHQALSEVNLTKVIDVPGSYLSQGQRRRMSLARILLCPRQVWLLDEPTAGLDHESEKVFSNLANRHISMGGVIIASTHLDIVGINPDIALLKQGGITLEPNIEAS